MGIKKDISGEQHGRLTVLAYSHSEGIKKYWDCICSCSPDKIIKRDTHQIIGTKHPSCGCWKREEVAKYFQNKKRKENEYIIKNDFVIGKIKNVYFYIDIEDFDLVKKYCWRLDDKGYILTKINCKNVFLHRFILNCKRGDIVDHIDRNPLNNRKNNLRIVDYRRNAQNKTKKLGTTSKYIGVCKRKDSGRWRAQIYGACGENIWLGVFDTEDEAALAYNKKAEELGYLTKNIIE